MRQCPRRTALRVRRLPVLRPSGHPTLPRRENAVRVFRLFLLCSVVAAVGPARAANWPQWRGPFFDGSTSETGLPETWSRTENVVWAAKMPGPSAATPIVWDDRVFVTAIEPASKVMWAICIDRGTGRERWKRKIGVGFLNKRGNTGASPSPVTDGKRVYFLFGTGYFAAFDMEGRPLWQRHIAREHGPFKIMWGYAASPLLYENRLYIAVLHQHTAAKAGAARPASYLLCVDPETGSDLWKHERVTDATHEAMEAYVTPYPFLGPGGPLIILPGGDHVTAHEPATGREVWRSDSYNPNQQKRYRTVVSAVGVAGVVFAAAPQGGEMFAIKAGGAGQLSPRDRGWTLKANSPDCCTPLAMDGKLFVLDGRRKIMTCLVPRSGELVWRGKLGGSSRFQASPTGADGRIYCINLRGTVVVVSAGDTFKVLSRIDMAEAGCRSTIAAAHRQLFIRTGTTLYCIGRKE